MTESDGAAGMQIVSKTGAVLALLKAAPELSVRDIAAQLDEPVSSMFRLISSLQTLEWVEPGTQRGTIRLGLEFVRLGESLQRRLDIRSLALPQLRELHDKTGETAFLCIRQGWRAVCIERIEGRDVQSHTLRLGASMPLSEGAAPQAILAWETDRFLERYFQAAADGQIPDLRPVRSEHVVESLTAAKVKGWAVSDTDRDRGIGGVGAPIFDHHGGVIAALSVSGLWDRVFGADPDAVGRLVRHAADAVSAACGYDTTVAANAQGSA